jgi:hypothetical protein
MSKDIDKYSDIEDLRENVPAKKGSMGEMIESFESDRTPIRKKKSNEIVPKKKPKEMKEKGAKQRQRQLNEAISLLEKGSMGYKAAEDEGFTHTNKAKSFNDDGDMDE